MYLLEEKSVIYWSNSGNNLEVVESNFNEDSNFFPFSPWILGIVTHAQRAIYAFRMKSVSTCLIFFVELN
jgi:hypothetical protein